MLTLSCLQTERFLVILRMRPLSPPSGGGHDSLQHARQGNPKTVIEIWMQTVPVIFLTEKKKGKGKGKKDRGQRSLKT